MRRYQEEHQRRRQLTGQDLTLRLESVGSKRIRYPCSPRCKRCALGLGAFERSRAQANALNAPPEDYGRKAKTQRN